MELPTNQIICGDCLEVMKGWSDNCVDTIITDIPYGIGFMGKEWDTFKDAQKSQRKGEFYTTRNIGGQVVKHTKGWSAASSAGQYDLSRNAEYQEWCRIWSAEALRIAKPGAFLLCFGGTRTYHRVTCGIEDAGWQIRDCMMWLYGSGFPKSLDISKAIDKAREANRKQQIENKSDIFGEYEENSTHRAGMGSGKSFGMLQTEASKENYTQIMNDTIPATDLAKLWSGYGTALKPAWEPIIVAMKPLDGTFAANAEQWGVAGLNIDGGRIGTETRFNQGAGNKAGGNSLNMSKEGMPEFEGKECQGRFPANLILDEEAAAMLDEQSGERSAGGKVTGRQSSRTGESGIYGHYEVKENSPFYDSGGASRFFYCAKASRTERNAGLEGMERRQVKRHGDRGQGGLAQQTPQKALVETNHHPTVKPLKLMEYLCRLLKPPQDGLLLDPFCGSGTTLMAAVNEGWDYIGIEKETEYVTIAEKRVARAIKQKASQMALFEGK